VSDAPTRKLWALVAVCFGLVMALLDITIVNVALPAIQATSTARRDDGSIARPSPGTL